MCPMILEKTMIKTDLILWVAYAKSLNGYPPGESTTVTALSLYCCVCHAQDQWRDSTRR